MKIGFDVSQTAEEKAGCGFVADQLIRHLAKIDSKNDYILYPTFYSYLHPECHKFANPGTPNCKPQFKGMSFKETVKGWNTSMTDRTPWLGGPDIVHANSFSCVKDHKAKIVYTLYDLTPLVCPEFLFEQNRINCFNGLFNASTYADHCIAISGNTKKDFLHFFPHYPEDRITVIPLGTRPGIESTMKPGLKKKVLEKFGLDGKTEFWLGVGTIEPRKNYRLLIEAFAELKDDRLLVIAGGQGWLESDIGDKVKSTGLEEKIKFLGYVSDEELSVLYSSCFAFVYPSFYEGFGLPVLEAMSRGSAVITSNTSSLPEVGGTAVLYIAPSSKKELVHQMTLLSNNPQKRKELQRQAIEQAKKFSWEKAAKIVLDVYEKTIKTPFFFKERKND